VEIPTTMAAIGHVAVTVTDGEASTEWYNRVLGNKPQPLRIVMSATAAQAITQAPGT
jgi:catechol-2,3-dioxygenase